MANKKKKTGGVKTDRRVIIVRIVCIVLALLMLGGVLAAAIMSAQAEELPAEETTGETTEDTAEETAEDSPEVSEEYKIFGEDDYLIRVGISYGDSSRDSHRVRTHNGASGFRLYKTTKDNSLEYLYTLDGADVSVCEAGNLRRSSDEDYYYYSSQSNTAAGGYHLRLVNEYKNEAEAKQALSALSEKAEQLEILVYPAYINGKFYINAGVYTSEDQALSEKAAVEEAFGAECVAALPTDTMITVIDHVSGTALFDFDMTDLFYGLGLYCLDNNGKKDYIKTYKGYYYDGVMEFRRYNTSGKDAVSMILISELETYVTCVVPWEIYNSWPTETMKAFSICARTFAIANSHEKAKHRQYDCDVCDSSDCQVCKGFDRVNANVINGVEQTRGQILLCDGETVTTYYTDLGGGSMAAAHEVWNMAAEKYLVGQMTPWEDLTVNRYGNWQFTVSPTELLKIVRNAGYTSLKGAIEDVKINRLCENSTYVYSITITDTYGTSVTVNRCRNVRLALSGLMYAANFVILHNGKIDDGKNKEIKETVSGLYVMTSDGIKMIDGEERINVQTGNGIKQKYLPERLMIKTSSSLVSQTVLISTGEVIGGGGSSGSSSDFTFIGHGNGHGVGASQWGCKDLGLLGYGYDQILYTYYPNTRVSMYEDYLGSD